MKLFELFATLGLDTSGFDKGVQGAQGKMSSLASTAGKAVECVGNGALSIGKAAASAAGSIIDTMENALKTIGTIGGGAMIALGTQAVSAAADIAAENAAFSATFGEMADEAKSAYAIIGEQANILDTRLQKTATKGFSQLKGAGMSANEALEASGRLLTLAADGAAYYDRSLEDTDERLRSFLRGNVEAGDSIGLFTSELQRNNKAVDLYGKKWDKLTESQRQMVMLNIAEEIYKQSGVIGQAERESEGWVNVIGNLKEAWRQTLAVIGTPIMDALTPIIQNLTTFLVEHKGDLEGFATQIGDIITMITTGHEIDAIDSGYGIINGFIASINEALEDGSLVEKGRGIINSLIDGFRFSMTGFGEIVQELAYPITDAVVNIKAEMLAAGIDIIGNFAKGLSENRENLEASVFGIVQRVTTAIEMNAPYIVEGAGAILLALADGLTDETSLSSISSAIETVIGSLVDWIATPGNTAKLTEAFAQLIGAAIEGAFNAIKENPMGILYGLLSPIATLVDSLTGGVLGFQESLDNAYATWQAMNGEGEIVGNGLAEQIGETAGAAKSLADAAVEAEPKVSWLDAALKGLEGTAGTTQEALDNVFPAADTSEIEGSISAVSAALSGLIAQAAAAAAAVSAVFTQDNTLNALYGAGYFATGLERVPYDGFPAILHKDEMVLDRKDANAYRNGDSPEPSNGGVTVIQNIQSVPQTASELAFQTMNALEMLRFSV